MSKDTGGPIYDPKLLHEIEFDKNKRIQYSPSINPRQPGPNLVLRPFSRNDINKGYLDVLTALTKVGNISQKQITEQCDVMFACPKSYYITVIEDTSTNKIIGNTTLHVEHKLYENCGLRGRIEDVAVLEEYRGKQLGKLLVEVSTLLARHLGCFRVSLHCFAEYMPFYSKQGFEVDEKENVMWLNSSYL